jgi:hypothetical protein
MKYRSESEINEMIAGFEDGSIAQADWRHAEHVLVACRYVTDHDTETATARMRAGIKNLLRSFGVVEDEKYPYHETLTVFWIKLVAAVRERRRDLEFFEFCRMAESELTKDLPLAFYSRELLLSDAARASYIEPDLRPLDLS